MVRIIGVSDRGLLHTNQARHNDGIHFTLTEFSSSHLSAVDDKKESSTEDSGHRIKTKFDLGPCPSKKKVQVIHATVQPLNTQSLHDDTSSKTKNTGTNHTVSAIPSLYLIGIVTKSKHPSTTTTAFTASLFLIRQVGGTSCPSEVLERVELVSGKESELRIHFLPHCSKTRYGGDVEESETDTSEDPDDESNTTTFSSTSRVLLLTLDESIVLYDVELSIYSSKGQNDLAVQGQTSRLEILSSEFVGKGFWWAQWLPGQEALAFAHYRKPRQSSFEEEDPTTPSPKPKPLFSVVQFHKDFPTESVLNMPLLELYTQQSGEDDVKLVSDPNVLTSSMRSPQLKLLAHPSGAVSLFHVTPNSGLKYSVNMLHHNKTLDVEVKLEMGQKKDLVLDVGLYSKDEYLMVVGWPHFIHFLDGGSSHEPSHHLVFEWNSFFGVSPAATLTAPFLCLFNTRSSSGNIGNGGSGLGGGASCDEKTDLSPKYSTKTHLIFHDLSSTPVKLSSSSLLLPLMEERGSDLQFKLAVLHHFLIHAQDINVAKRIIYDEGKKRGNLFLRHIYQEFLIGHAHLQTKKQILPNMDSFLYLIPYSADPSANSKISTSTLDIKLQEAKQSDVSIMLLSPSQRVFPHNVSDLWTCLWHLNRNHSRSKRFNHKEIAEKLILSLQCYKPEALSRASTPGPMSPSSPMICTSLGDIVGMFGRRATELQLPFLEHESCTANKQEYIFSINLREMSMHLLKERKEWPLHGHTVAGKYVCALGDTARLLCHLLCLTVHLQPTKNRDKGFKLIDGLEWEVRLKLFMLMEHYTLALSTLASPLPQGFTPFFAYLGYRVLNFDQFLWHVKAGTFDLQIDLVKIIMTDIKEDRDENVRRKLQLLSLLPKTRANRILNTWPHKISVSLRARQHASDLMSGSVAVNRKRIMTAAGEKKKKAVISEQVGGKDKKMNPLDTFYNMLACKANPSEIDLGLLTEATLISMEGSEFG